MIKGQKNNNPYGLMPILNPYGLMPILNPVGRRKNQCDKRELPIQYYSSRYDVRSYSWSKNKNLLIRLTKLKSGLYVKSWKKSIANVLGLVKIYEKKLS